MPPTCRLSKLSRGIPAVVCDLQTKGAMRRRLMEIGLTPGAPVVLLFQSLSGESAAYKIQSSVFALRHEDAFTVVVKAL